jgi:hypothetical protein
MPYPPYFPKRNRKLLSALAGALMAGCSATAAAAGPWAESGDAGLRSDVELLESARLVHGITMQWPIAWSGLYARLHDNPSLESQPAHLRAAARRVSAAAKADTRTGFFAESLIDLTNEPGVIRGFDALGRQKAQSRFAFGFNGEDTTLRLAVGAQSSNRHDHQTLMFDGSYIAQRLGNSIVYAGYLDHWWGPGWMSALSLSSNARPMPQIGIMRADPKPFTWPILRWLGHWQAQFLVGVMDGPRANLNTIYTAARISVNPFPGFELGFGRTTQMCGTGVSCSPLADWFHISNNSATGPNNTNDQGMIDVRYSGRIEGVSFSLYAQEMNEVQSNPLPQEVSHLAGLTLWSPVAGGLGRLTLEYTSTVPLYQLLWGGIKGYGWPYNSGQYRDGMRYRGRSLGFSLDSDSEMFSLQGDWRSENGIGYRLSFHSANVSHPLIASVVPTFYNAVTTTPVHINMVEARLTLPFKAMDFELAVRAQDDQPRPDSGATAAVELAIRIRH